ncbi:hypothetical protein ACIBCM_06395 [Streptomyces sp. NPDC051018]|uniref:hypothetical protein n=1 Tax=Streptomyces sp. NPDC051018 TaxID=3365639 RepID=UPI0037ACEF41
MPDSRHHRMRTVVLALTLALTAATGCDTESTGSPTGPPARALIGQELSAQRLLTLPFDTLEPSKQDNILVQRATMRLLRTCMASAGLAMELPEVRPSPYPKHATVLGWLGAHQVEKYGYRGPEGFAGEMAAASRRESRPIVISPEHDGVFSGSVRTFKGKAVPTGGCDGQTRRTLNGGNPRILVPGEDPHLHAERGLQALEQQAADLARSSGRFGSLVRSWASCMKERGHRYKNPDEAQADPRWESDAARQKAVSPSEIATALDDRDCRAKVNFSGVLRELIARQEHRILGEENPTGTIAALLRTRVRNAEKVLSNASPLPY